MNSLKLIIFSFLFINGMYGQVRVKFIDQSSKKPISNVICMYKGQEIASSNASGDVVLPKTIDHINVMTNGYESQFISTGLEDKTIFLIPKFKDMKIKEVVVKNKVDAFAQSIIQQMLDRNKENHINQLNSYNQIVYNKILLDEKKKDSTAMAQSKLDSTISLAKKEIDTELENYVKDNAFFVWERVFQHKHDIRYGEKSVVLSSSMSGLKQPIYEILAEMYRVNSLPYVFRDDRDEQLTFSFEDTVVLNDRKSYFLSFFTKKKFRTKNSISGTFYVDAKTFALVKFLGENKGRYIEYKYKFFDEKYYTDNSYASIVMNNIEAGDKKVAFQIFTKTSEFTSPHSFEKKEFKGNEYEISKELNSTKSSQILEKYRTDSLTKRESNTFVTLDSMTKKDNLEGKLRLFLALRSGELKINKVNLNLVDALNFNGYEGFRINIGGRTNYNFSPKWSLNGYVGYGFKDAALKYGAGVEYLTSYEMNSKVGFQGSKDVSPIGRANQAIENRNFKLNEMFYSNYFEKISMAGFYSSDINRYIVGKLGLEYLSQKALMNYQYNGQDMNTKYEYFSPSLSLKYSPKSKNINTPEGKFEIENKPTKFFLTLNTGISLNDKTSNFYKTSLKFITKIKSSIGTTNLSANTGMVLGNTPLFNMYEAMGVARSSTNFNLASHDGFMTMPSGLFYSDRQASIFIRHSIISKKIFKKFGFNPNVAYSATLGDMNDMNRHNLNINSPNKLYQETGLELRNILLGLGLGAYYRFGAYNNGVFKDNIAFSLTYDMPIKIQ